MTSTFLFDFYRFHNFERKFEWTQAEVNGFVVEKTLLNNFYNWILQC